MPPNGDWASYLERVLLPERVEALDEVLQRRPEAVLAAVIPQVTEVPLELLFGMYEPFEIEVICSNSNFYKTLQGGPCGL